MARWLLAALLAFLLVLGLWAGYQGYTRFLALEGKVAALEARVAAQEEALKALGDRVGRLEAEVFQRPRPPLPAGGSQARGPRPGLTRWGWWG
ncbi:MAG: hypothetical protein ABDH20_00575 [Thermus sp.]